MPSVIPSLGNASANLGGLESTALWNVHLASMGTTVRNYANAKMGERVIIYLGDAIVHPAGWVRYVRASALKESMVPNVHQNADVKMEAPAVPPRVNATAHQDGRAMFVATAVTLVSGVSTVPKSVTVTMEHLVITSLVHVNVNQVSVEISV